MRMIMEAKVRLRTVTPLKETKILQNAYNIQIIESDYLLLFQNLQKGAFLLEKHMEPRKVP